jgi:hypothetical protein
MADPEVAADFTRLSELDRERQEIEELAQVYRRYAGRNDPASRKPGSCSKIQTTNCASWPNSKASSLTAEIERWINR